MSILGITFSVMLFLIIDSLIHGLVRDVKETMIGFEAPLFLDVPSSAINEGRAQLTGFSQKNPDFNLQFYESHQFDGLLTGSGGIILGAKVRSVNEAFFDVKRETLNVIFFDGFSEEEFLTANDQILIGSSLYERLHVVPGEEESVQLTHPFAELGPAGEVEPAEKTLKVAGVFWTGRVDYDDLFTLIPQRTLKSLADVSLLETTFFVHTPKLDRVFVIEDRWKKFCPDASLAMTSWFDRNAAAFKAIRLERVMYTFIFLLVTIISCFNLAGVIAIFSLGKARDAGILRSLGLSVQDIKKIFISLGLFLGGLGGVLGVVLGLATIGLVSVSDISLPATYGFTKLPLAVNPLTVILLLIGTPVVSGFMAFVPSARFARVEVVDVLKA
jgi:ABC-type lipoprotein release transport system permease subunit